MTAEVLPSVPLDGKVPTLLPSPAREGLHSTSEIAAHLGVSPNCIGRRAKHLKLARHGEWRPAVALHSGKAVSQWWWNEAGRRAVMREFGASSARRDRPN